MADSDLLHIRVGKEMKKQMRKLIDIGLFSTEAEIAREGIRNLLLRYMKESGLDKTVEKEQEQIPESKEKNERKK
jgi:Arc/MetJ-type ribon-helix-helix transcriptional regulator